MRFIKISALAVVQAILALALLGSATASAHSTALCTANELPCSGLKTVANGEPFNGELVTGTESIFLVSAGEVKCSISKFNGKTTSGLATTLTIRIEGLVMEGCKIGKTVCAVITIGLPYTGSLLYTAGSMSGELQINGITFEVYCGLPECVYGATSVLLTLDPGTPAKLLAVKEPLEFKPGLPLCTPPPTTWDATYKITSQPTLFVSE